MSYRYVIANTRQSAYCVRVVADSRAECAEGKERVLRFLSVCFPTFRAMKSGVYHRDGLFTDVVPVPTWAYSGLIRMTDKMVSAGLQVVVLCTWLYSPVSFPEFVEEVEVDNVCPFAGMNLESMTKARLISLAKEHGVRIGSKFTKQQVIESLQDHIVEVPV